MTKRQVVIKATVDMTYDGKDLFATIDSTLIEVPVVKVRYDQKTGLVVDGVRFARRRRALRVA